MPCNNTPGGYGCQAAATSGPARWGGFASAQTTLAGSYPVAVLQAAAGAAGGGAVVGTVVPVVGTAIGGVVGGPIGAVAGGILAGKASNAIVGRFIEDDAKHMIELIEAAFKQLGQD